VLKRGHSIVAGVRDVGMRYACLVELSEVVIAGLDVTNEAMIAKMNMTIAI
jgi:hypothetical protein